MSEAFTTTQAQSFPSNGPTSTAAETRTATARSFSSTCVKTMSETVHLLSELN